MTTEDTARGIGNILADSKKAAEKAAPEKRSTAGQPEGALQDVSFSTEVGDGHPQGFVGNPFFGSRPIVPDAVGNGDLNAYLAARNREVPTGGEEADPDSNFRGISGNRGS